VNNNKMKNMENSKICDAHVHLGKSGPWQPYMEASITAEFTIYLQIINSVNISQKAKRKILRENFMKLFKIEGR